MNKYYVYALLVGADVESLTPFYIGKGCGNRMNNHFKPWSLKQRSYKNNKIIAAQKAGLILKAVKLWDNLPEDIALEMEQQEILWFNTTSIKLCNVYDGGLAKNYDKNVRKVEPEELGQLIRSFLSKPGVMLLSDWIKHVEHVYSVGSAKNIYRGPVYERLRAEYPGFGGNMSEEQKIEHCKRQSARVSGDKNPTALPKLSGTQLELAKLLCPGQGIQDLRNYVSNLGYARPPLNSWPKPPRVKVIRPPKPPKARKLIPLTFKIGYNELEKRQIMQMYLLALEAEPLRMSPSVFVQEYGLIVNGPTVSVWFTRRGITKPKAIGNKSNGGKVTALKNQRPIGQYKNGELIAAFSSCTQAATQLGYSQGNIRNVCEGVWPKAYGFEWRYTTGCVPEIKTTTEL